MTAEVGAGQSAHDIHAVADPAWLTRVRRATGAEPFLDEDGVVVIPVVSGNGLVLEGAPPDRTIKLPALGAHQARMTVVVGPSTLQRVIISAHERLDEISIAATPSGIGSIDDLTINATRDDKALEVTGGANMRVVRLRGRVAVSPSLIRPTTVIDLRDTRVTMIGASSASAAQLRLSGSVQVHSTWTVRSSHITPGTIIENVTSAALSLGIVNPKQRLSDPPLEITLRSPVSGGVHCEYLPPASRVQLEQGRLVLECPGPPSGASLEDKAVAPYLQAPPAMIEQLTITGAGRITTARDLESPTFTPKGGELELHVRDTGNVMNASGRVGISAVEEDALLQGSADSPLVATSVGNVNGAELERINIYELSVGDVRRLQPAARVTPWIPGARAARRRELAMRLGTDNKQLQAERRADFWTKLAAILSSQQVLGSAQSNVRLASMRARRRALPRGREKFWLWVVLADRLRGADLAAVADLAGRCGAPRHSACQGGRDSHWYRLRTVRRPARAAGARSIGIHPAGQLASAQRPRTLGHGHLDRRAGARNRVRGLLPGGDPKGHPSRTLTSRQLNHVEVLKLLEGGGAGGYLPRPDQPTRLALTLEEGDRATAAVKVEHPKAERP
jgi:hypothetical protein